LLESVDKVDERTWTILGKKDASAWSAGELVRVVIQQTGADSTAVRIISKKRIATKGTVRLLVRRPTSYCACSHELKIVTSRYSLPNLDWKRFVLLSANLRKGPRAREL
jgi:hypothetical protein